MVSRHGKGSILASIFIKQGLEKGRRIEIENKTTTIGSSRRSHIRLTDKGVLKSHAVIQKRSNGSFFIGKEQAESGLLVNRERVDMADLSDGTVISIGSAILQFNQKPGEIKPDSEQAEDHAALDIFHETEIRKKQEGDKKEFRINKTQITIAASIVAFGIGITIFFISLNAYNPDETEAINALAPMAQNLIESGAIKINPNKTPRKQKLVGYYEDKDSDKLKISGGPKPKGHMKFDGGKISKEQKDAIDKSDKAKSNKGSSGFKSKGKTGGGKSSGLNAAGGGTLKTGDMSAGSGSGSGGKQGSGSKGGGSGLGAMGSKGGTGKIKTGNVSGGSGAGASDSMPAGGSGDGTENIPQNGNQGDASVESGGVSQGQAAGDVNEMLDNKSQDMEKAKDLGLDKFKGKEGSFDREKFRSYNPTGNGGFKAEKTPVPFEKEKDQDKINRGYYLLIDTFEFAPCGEIVVVEDEAGGFVILWYTPFGITGQRLDCHGVSWDDNFQITGRYLEEEGMPFFNMDNQGNYIVEWNPEFL